MSAVILNHRLISLPLAKKMAQTSRPSAGIEVFFLTTKKQMKFLFNPIH